MGNLGKVISELELILSEKAAQTIARLDFYVSNNFFMIIVPSLPYHLIAMLRYYKTAPHKIQRVYYSINI